MKHIIWDFNGTLLNDAQLSVDLDNYVFDQIGVPRITLADYRNNMTMPVRDFYPLVGVDYARHSYEEIARLWLDEFNQKAVGVGLLPGAQLRELGLSGADVVLVGDMLADAHLAQALGADCVLVSWGHNDLKRLQSTGLPVAHSFEELESILAKY